MDGLDNIEPALDPRITEEEEEQEEEEEEEDDEMKDPLEIGGFLTTVNAQPINPPTLVYARDLSVGQAILINNQPFDIISRSDSRAPSGALASRHKVTLKLVELFDKGHRDPLVVKATEEIKRVDVARVRYTMLNFGGPDDDIMFLEKQSLDPGNRNVVMFNVSGGKIGEDLGALFAQCEESNEKPAIPITLLILEAMGKFQVTGFGIGDWESLG